MAHSNKHPDDMLNFYKFNILRALVFPSISKFNAKQTATVLK